MKLLIINDTHYGVKSGHEVYMAQAEQFFDKVFKTCQDYQIKHIIHLGDFFDNRRQIPIDVISRAKSRFLDRLDENDLIMHIIPGNHDVTYRNTNRLNSLEAIFRPYYDDHTVRIYTEPQLLDPPLAGIGVVPWITEDNRDDCMEFIRNADCSVLMGHFEIEGFRYIPNSPQKSVGLPRSTFDRYEMVLSGHYHTKSHAGNITYLGAPYPMNWGDVDDEKYFHILDTKGWLLTPILNDDTVYAKIEYSGSKPSGVEDWSWIEGKFVRLVVTDRGDDLDQYESFVTTLQSCNPYDLKIFEDYQLTLDDSSSSMDDNSEPSVEDTRTLLGNYVRSIQTDSGISKDRLEDLILSLYTEATSDSAS